MHGKNMAIVDGKIWAPHQVFYIQGMLFNAHSAMRSIMRLTDFLEKIPENVTEEYILNLPTHALLNELQNIIVNGAALSRYFWPVRKGHESRGENLRSAFQITENSALYSRDLRNDIEHFDERLDKYLSGDIVGYIFPEFLGFRPIEKGVQGHFFRAYFIECAIFKLLEAEYEMEPLIQEIIRVNKLLLSADQNGGMFPKA